MIKKKVSLFIKQMRERIRERRKSITNKRKKMQHINGTPPQINVAQLKDFECPHCKGIYFLEVKRIKELTKFQSPNGQAGLVPINALQCLNCKTISDPLNPPQPETPKKEIIL